MIELYESEYMKPVRSNEKFIEHIDEFSHTKDQLKITKKALELACEHIWGMSTWEDSKERVIADTVEFFINKAKEMENG